MNNSMVLDIETTGLNSLTDKIICIVTYKGGVYTTYFEDDEKHMLEDFWFEYDGETVVGYNSDSFDIPFLYKRSIINNVKIKKIPKFIDLRKIVNSFYISYQKHEPGKLSDWAEVLGIPVKTEDGEKMIECNEKGDTRKIIEHCKEDTKITKALFERCVSCGLI